jgi:type II secretory pathway predicted ATPase ExeA
LLFIVQCRIRIGDEGASTSLLIFRHRAGSGVTPLIPKELQAQFQYPGTRILERPAYRLHFVCDARIGLATATPLAWARCILAELPANSGSTSILVTPMMFVILGCATSILLVVILIATSTGKKSVLGSPHNLYSKGASRPTSKSNSAEKLRPTIRQGLDTKAVPKASVTSSRSEAAKPAESAAGAVEISEPVLPVELTAAAPLPAMIEETVSSPLTDDSATPGYTAPAQEAAEVDEAASLLVQEVSVAEPSAVRDHERSEAVEFASCPVAVDGPLSSETFLVALQEAGEAVEMPLSLVTEGGASDFTPGTAQETEECAVSQGLLVAELVEEPGAPNLLAFYGLTQQPFDLTPDPAYLYRSRVHREALTALSHGIENLRGFAALVAEPGMGKTTLLNKLMEDLRDSARIVFLFQTQCNSSELLRYLLTELGIEHGGMDIAAMHKALSQVLIEEMAQGRRVVLIVDEAQNLQDSVLETIRLLSNYETTQSKLIQIVLAGQPQLVDTLMRPGLVQLRQRIAVVANLEPLDAVETAEYIEHRLRAAGSGEPPIFTREAMELIAERSEGIPRSINNLCFNAMLAGYLHRQLIIDSGIINRVASKLDLERLVRRPQQEPLSAPPDASAGPSELSQLAQLLCTALASKTQQGVAEDEPKASLSLTGKLTEKLASQSWSNKNEFRIQVSLERDYFPGLPVADHYYCCSFYVSEEQAKGLEPGKVVRVRFEQD